MSAFGLITYRVASPERGVMRSRVLPGLWLDAPALLQRDMQAVLAVLHDGLRSPDHAASAARMGA